MALVEKYHVVAAVKAVAAGQTIREGQVVGLTLTGEVVLQGVSVDGDRRQIPYGIAGDTKSTTASYMPGIAAGWQNRVSDYFDETKASAKMTVYHSGGEFATDMFVTNVASAVVGQTLYANSGYLSVDNPQGSGAVAILTATAAAYPSGVPGIDTTTYDATAYTGDMALGGNAGGVANSNLYIEYKLVI